MILMHHMCNVLEVFLHTLTQSHRFILLRMLLFFLHLSLTQSLARPLHSCCECFEGAVFSLVSVVSFSHSFGVFCHQAVAEMSG